MPDKPFDGAWRAVQESPLSVSQAGVRGGPLSLSRLSPSRRRPEVAADDAAKMGIGMAKRKAMRSRLVAQILRKTDSYSGPSVSKRRPWPAARNCRARTSAGQASMRSSQVS